MTKKILSDKQVGRYFQDGYLLVSGLIPDQVSAKAEGKMWQELGFNSDDPKSWEGAESVFHSNNADLIACYTDDFLSATTQLSGDEPATFHKPSGIFAINTYPSEGEWHWPHPHIDHAIKEHGHKSLPRPFRIAAMTYINDVDQHGGGTVVWPESHHKIRMLLESDIEKYQYVWELGRDIHTVDLNNPIELTPKRGDILFYHYFCAHTGSKNTSNRPRFAYNTKW